MSAIVEVTKMSRWYGMVMGLNNISFELHPGLTGLVGPNGAGKSTLISIITGQLKPSSGTVKVFGASPYNNPALLRRIGYCPERESLPTDLRPADWLRGLGLLAGMSTSVARQRAESMLDRVGLAREHWHKKMGEYSKGMRQRAKLGQSLIHNPDLIVLDEPMNGLDPMGREEVARILKELVEDGVSILISSHILAELESLCGTNIILNWGRVIASGSKNEIRADVRNWSEELSIVCDDPEKLAGVLFEAGVLAGFDIDPETDSLKIRVKDQETFYPRWTGLLLESGVTVFEVCGQSRSLKQIFEKVTT
jgi:ABC-2 type transport system ATP-binding protein